MDSWRYNRGSSISPPTPLALSWRSSYGSNFMLGSPELAPGSEQTHRSPHPMDFMSDLGDPYYGRARRREPYTPWSDAYDFIFLPPRLQPPFPIVGWDAIAASFFSSSGPGSAVSDVRPQQGLEDAQERNRALKLLKKEKYNPTPRRLFKRLSLYYRNRNSSTHGQNENDSEDGEEQRCAVCLEDFEPGETVAVTPCKHMFHEDCIVPWIMSHSKCPVCRRVFSHDPEVPTSPLTAGL